MPDFSGAAQVLQRFLDSVPGLVELHRAADGGYTRDLADERAVSDTYGLADGIGVLWSVDALPAPADRRRLGKLLVGLQASDGSFPEPTHGAMHSTAMSTGSLGLLGVRVDPGMPFVAELWRPESLAPFLESRDWTSPWFASHEVAGLAAIAESTRAVGPAWFDAYFAWLDRTVDPATGLWREGLIGDLSAWPGLFANLGCSFHMHFTYCWHHRLLPAPEALVDSCLRIFDQVGWISGTEHLAYAEVDWVYSLRRAVAQSGHRAAGARERLSRFRDRAVEIIADPSFERSEHVTDLHTLSATVAVVAELRDAFPELVGAGRPSRLVLEARPFI
jgi:hypothetical protein